ncbi:MAG: hypothetical protein F2934_00080 [Actinobacteria bacterium]|uniref:Unannotated protein n=1 Tax=freshwater metagenome TaxID=449393 RepID=A0A6J6PJL0_9ZZZZ|nr:hypothetical protein [Actinomycetota bacterium]MSY11944.1 hypothetical protein [Actinomycetota bacterium]MSZ03798.1 hypothetical protein [Actinomycetota bacterium]MTB05510.1 hypothetical protein [Actinomycetota bacterium]
MTSRAADLGQRQGGTAADRGSVSLIVIGVVAVAVALLLSIGRFGRDLDDSARAQTAADAAALAGVQGGRQLAAEVAEANGAELVSFVADNGSVRVTTAVSGAVASARAIGS